MQDSAGRDRNVENLFDADRQASHRVIMDLLKYWESLRAGRIAPARSEIDPRMIKSALKHTFILEFDPIGGTRFRLAGDKICALTGMELRGMPASTLIDIPDRQEFEKTLQLMARNPEIVEYRLAASCENQLDGNARMLLLPMQDAAGQVTRVLGGLSLRAPLFDPPLRFGIVEKLRTRIVSAPGQAPVSCASGFAEDAPAFVPRDPTGGGESRRTANRPAKPGTPYLKIVTDNYGRTHK